jgi:transcriptional regulator with XRE-family HTH domain
MSDEKPSRQKFKWTKELVNIALNDGMTQEEIARVCRTQQSVVSSWKNGKNKATEQQLAELLRRYGARLNRTTARIYLVHEEPVGNWQETEIGRRLMELRECRKALAVEIIERRKAAAQAAAAQKEAGQEGIADKPKAPTARLRATLLFSKKLRAKSSGTAVVDDDDLLLEADELESWQQPEKVAEKKLEPELAAARKLIDRHSQEHWRLDDLIRNFAKEFMEGGRQRLVQVDGPIMFRYTFVRPIKRERNKRWELGREPVARWLVHDLQRGKLLLVIQERRQLIGFQRERWDREVSRLESSFVSYQEPSWIDCPDDAGRWLSFLKGPLSVEELLLFVDRYLHDPEALHRPHDELVLPYLIRKSLAEHGHPVPGIDRITGLE